MHASQRILEIRQRQARESRQEEQPAIARRILEYMVVRRASGATHSAIRQGERSAHVFNALVAQAVDLSA